MDTSSARQLRPRSDDRASARSRAIHVAPEVTDDGWLIVEADVTRVGFRFWLDESCRLYDAIALGGRVRHISIEGELVREELCRAEIRMSRDGRAQVAIVVERLIHVSRTDGVSIPRT